MAPAPILDQRENAKQRRYDNTVSDFKEGFGRCSGRGWRSRREDPKTKQDVI